MSASGGKRAVIAALLANAGIAVTKFIAFAVTGASSMLAEAIHSVADSGNQVLLLVGARRAEREATKEHPFGYGRTRYVYAFIVAIVLFTVGGLFALYEAFHKYEEVHAGEPNQLLDSGFWWVAVAVLVGAIVMESFSFRTAIVESNLVRGGQSWVEFVRHAKSPELPVILLEDLGALCGLVFALFGVGMTLITGNGMFDVIGTAMIGVLLVLIAVILALEMSSLLIGEGASAADAALIEEVLTSVENVERLIHMKTLFLGPEELMVAAKIGITGNISGADLTRAIDDAEARIRQAVPIARVIYLEPDVYSAERSAAGGAPFVERSQGH